MQVASTWFNQSSLPRVDSVSAWEKLETFEAIGKNDFLFLFLFEFFPTCETLHVPKLERNSP